MKERAGPADAPPRFHGHDGLRDSLGRALDRGTLPATMLIHGMPGAGKQTLALWLARRALCTGDPAPCDRCTSCRLALRVEHPDIHWHFPLPRPGGRSGPGRLAEKLEAARHERLAEFRREPLRAVDGTGVKGIYLAAVLAIRKAAHRRPAMGPVQFFVVGDAEHMVPQEASPEAANALLKMLEEPPDGSRFILTSSKPGSLLDTIRSRALPIHLPPLPTHAVAAFLEEERGAKREAAHHAAVLAQGSIGAALGYLAGDGVPARERGEALNLLRTAVAGRTPDPYRAALGFKPSGARGLLDLLASLQLWIRDLGAAALGRDDRVVNRDELPFLRDTAQRLNIVPHRIARAVGQVEEARMLAQGNVNPQLLAATLLLDLAKTLNPPATR